MLLPNNINAALQKLDLQSLKAVYKQSPSYAETLIKDAFSLTCVCNYHAYIPFPRSCPKCGRSNHEEIQQYNHFVKEIMNMVVSDLSKREGSVPKTQERQQFCPNCRTAFPPNHEFCTECGKKRPPQKSSSSQALLKFPTDEKNIPLWEQLYDEGTILMKERKLEDALEKFHQALKLNDQDAELLSNTGIVYLHLEQQEEGMKWLDRSLALKPYEPITLFNKSLFLAQNTQYDEAVDVLEILIKHNPNFSQAKVLLMQTKRQQDLFGGLNLEKKEIPPAALTHFRAGMESMHKNQIPQAIRRFNSAIDIFPDFAEAYMFIGVVTILKGDTLEGLSQLEKAIEIDPFLSKAWTHKGWVYDKLEQYEDAIDCYDTAIKIDPKYSANYNNKGLALERLERYEEAIEAYDKSIELNPDYAGAYHNRAVAYKTIGKIERAVENYQKALELNPQNEEAKENIDRLKHYISPKEEGVIRSVHDARDYCPRCQKKNYTNSPNCPYCSTPMHSEDINKLIENVIEMEAMGQFESALMTLERINNKDPTNTQAWYYRGKAHCALAEFRNAMVCFAKAQEFGFSAIQLMMYGLTAKMNIDNFKPPNLSEEHLATVELKMPGFFPDEESYTANGAALQMLMQYEQAYKSYQKALEKKPGYAPALKNLELIKSIAKK